MGNIKIFAMFGVLLVLSGFAFATDIDSCQTFTTPDTYTLNASIDDGSGNCIIFATGSDGSIFNGNGFYVNETAGRAIYLNTVENITISNTTATATSNHAIDLDSSSNNTITNTTATSTNDYGIYLYSSSGNSIGNGSQANGGLSISGCGNNITNLTDTGKAIEYYDGVENIAVSNPDAAQVIFCNVNNSFISNTTATSTIGYAIYLDSSSNNTITNTTATATSNHAIYLESSSGNTISNTTATASDNYAIYLHSSSGNTISNTTATNTIGYAIYLRSSSGNTISNTTATSSGDSAIDIYAQNNSITNSIFTSTSNYGILLEESYNTIDNVTASGSIAGMLIYYSIGSNISNSHFSGDGLPDDYYCDGENYGAAVHFDCIGDGGSENNTLWNNTFSSTGNNASLVSFSDLQVNELLYWNNFTYTNESYILYTDNVTDLAEIHLNTTIGGVPAGNIWAEVANGSLNITGTDAVPWLPSGWYYGSGGPGYPYNYVTSSGKIPSGLTDFGPIFFSGEAPTCDLIVEAGTGGTAVGNQTAETCGVPTVIEATPSGAYTFDQWTLVGDCELSSVETDALNGVTVNSGTCTATASFNAPVVPPATVTLTDQITTVTSGLLLVLIAIAIIGAIVGVGQPFMYLLDTDNEIMLLLYLVIAAAILVFVITIVSAFLTTVPTTLPS